MNLNTFFRSKLFKAVLLALGGFIALLFAFKLGVIVGYRKANFSFRWGENYHRNFGGPRGGFFGEFKRGFGERDFIGAHGTFGSVIRVDGNTIILKGQDDIERIVFVSDKTDIRAGREAIKASDLKPDDRITVIGSPNAEGQIEAKFIRVFGKDMTAGFPARSSRLRFF